MKWMMGWMHDTLRYFKQDFVIRHKSHHDITFSISYAFDEKYVLPLSHDEVVHGKSPMLYKMFGDEWQKHANLRALYLWMYTHPGAKLLLWVMNLLRLQNGTSVHLWTGTCWNMRLPKDEKFCNQTQ